MFHLFIFTLLWAACTADDLYEYPHNLTRSTLSGIAAYRSALTLDWLAGEDSRQRELVQSYETEKTVIKRGRVADCIAYALPAAGKVARLMLELLKNLEGDDGPVIAELIQVLMRSKLLVETAMMDSEPNLDSLVETPGVMMGEPHATLPRMISLTWLVTTDPVTTKREGWCPVRKLNHYLLMARPSDIAKQMHGLDPIVARARFIMEDFIRKVTPLNMFQADTTLVPAPETQVPVTRTTRANVVVHHQTKAQRTKVQKTKDKEEKAKVILPESAPVAPPPPAPFPFPYELVDQERPPEGFAARRSEENGRRSGKGGGKAKPPKPAPPAVTPATTKRPPQPTEQSSGEIGAIGAAGRTHRLTWLTCLLPFTGLVLS